LEVLLIVFLVLFLVGALVTVIGHGIWVLLATIFGGNRASSSTPAPTVGSEHRACPRCHVAMARTQQVCGNCNWPHKSTLPTDGAAALQALRRQLEVFTQQGAFDVETCAKLAAAIGEQEQRLAAKAAISAPELASTTAAPPAQTPVTGAAPHVTASSPSVAKADAAPAVPHAPEPLRDRARKYAASREVAMTEALAEPVAPVEPPKQREALSRLFAAFMEEKNIRWGELVGGLLIVGCSIALVISFWSQIAAQPLLKFVLFNGVTAALFGLGIYTDRRWKIHTTSHGVLVIATLLVPLNFLAIAAFTQASPPTDLLSLSGEGLSLIAFALLVYFAGRILAPSDAILLAAAVMIPCLVQLLVRRFAGPASGIPLLYLLAVVPVLTYIATVAVAAGRRWLPASDSETSLSELEANRMLMFLGIATAATAMPLALLLHNVPPLGTTLHWLAPLGALCGLPALVTGLLFWRRMNDPAKSGLQTAGIAVGALGAFTMAAAVVSAWPDPATLLPTALAMAVAMLAVAVWFKIPAAHFPAGIALAAIGVVGFYLVRGDVGWTLDASASMRRVLLSATTGHVLVPLVAVFGGLAGWLHHRGHREASNMYGLVAAAAAIVGLGLVLVFGFARMGDPENATWTLALYALAAIIAAIALDRGDVARAGSALLLAAIGQGVVFRFNPALQLERPWIAALLAHASLVSLASAALINTSRTLKLRAASAIASGISAINALAHTALITSVAAAVWIMVTSYVTSASTLCVQLAWLGGVWLVLAALLDSRAAFTASQIAIIGAILCGVTAAVETRTWYTSARHPWLDPRFLEAQGIALAAYCAVLTGIRWLIGRGLANGGDQQLANPWARPLAASDRLINPPWPAVDQVVSNGVVAITVLVAAYAVLPGAAQELTPTQVAGDRVVTPIEQFQIAGIAHRHAADQGAWLLLAAAAAAIAPQLARSRADWRRVGLVAVGAIMCLLLAARWEGQVAVASALRWLSAGLLVVASAATWAMERSDSSKRPQNRMARDLLVAFVVAVYVCMGAYVVQSALARAAPITGSDELWWWIFAWTLPAAIATLILFVQAKSDRESVTPLGGHLPSAWVRQMRWVLLLVAMAPAAVAVTFIVSRSLDTLPIVGPEPTSWFRRIGFDWSYGAPLVAVALTLIGYAVAERSSPFAFAAGLLFNVVATIILLLRLAKSAAVLDSVAWISVAQLNALVAGAVALVWIGALHVGESLRDSQSHLGETRPRGPLLLISQVALAAALCGTFLIPAIARLSLLESPRILSTPAWVSAAGRPIGWIAFGLSVTAALWLNGRRRVGQPFVALAAAALVSLIALTVLRHSGSDVTAYHTLLTGCCIAAWVLPVAAWGADRLLAGPSIEQPNYLWSAWPVRLFGIAAVVLALWEYSAAASWWVVAALAAIALRNIVVAWRESRRGSVWIAAVLVVVATSIWWLDMLKKAAAMRGPGDFFAFLWTNVLAVAAMAVVSVWVERRRKTSSDVPIPLLRGIAFHRVAAWAIVAALLLTTGIGLIADLLNDSFTINQPLAWGAWLGAMIAAAACLWDPAVRWPIACLYCVGLVAVGMYLDGLDLRAPLFHWALALALASYSLATSTLWYLRDNLRAIAARLGVPAATEFASRKDATTWGSLSETAKSEFRRSSATWEDAAHGWLVPVNFVIGLAVLLLVVLVELTMDNQERRFIAAYAVGAQAVALALLARGAVRTSLQYLSLVWGAVFAVTIGWALIPTDFPAPWLHRLVATVVALAAVVVVYGFGLVKLLNRENEWTRAAGRFVPPLAALAGSLIFIVLGIEVAAYLRNGSVPIVPAALVAVIVALAGLAVAALLAALVPGRDPLGLSERGRTLYVYIAEGIGALLFLHIRLTMPWLFSGWFLRFWPLIVMVIAFLGVGLSEAFRRRQQRVLYEPLEITGALLPILPVLGFWAMPSHLYQVHYSVLLLSIGVLYAALSVLRGSFTYGILATIAANGSLWYFLHERQGLDFTQHPQLWLIPPALCVLAAGYINRARLTPEQSAALRYASAIVIYVSSTADIFINGVAEAPWLPAVLAGLSIIGVLAGILLRVRAFLYLGTAFLVVALLTIIWHAAEGHTWVWWIAGIVTGILIIALFGLFEKRRDDVLRVVEQLKHWEA
jgi:hypothetical protein